MQPENKRKLMLGVLAVLLLARFILVPVFDWQKGKIAQIAEKEQRLIKTNNVIEHVPQINLALKQLNQNNNKQQERYFVEASSNTFKLQIQQKIEKLFSEHTLKVTNFNWVAEIPGEIAQARADISFEGTTTQFAMLQLAIAQLPKALDIKQWTLQVKGMNERSLGDVNGSLILIAHNIAPQTEAQ
jgi:ribosomal protein L23